jgi:penicillin-binding protein 1A
LIERDLHRAWTVGRLSAKWIAAAVACGVALVGGVLHSAWQTCGWMGCPEVSRLTARQIEGASLLLDRNGQPFANLRRTEPRMVALATLPDSVRHAFLAIEDQRFYEHAGVDWRRVAGAMAANLRARRFAQSFSTISMQLARNLFPERIPGRAPTLRRKLLEIRVAREIEERFSRSRPRRGRW